MYYALCAGVCLAAFCLVAALGTAGLLAAAPLLRWAVRRRTARSRAALCFAAGILPAAAALLISLAVVLPAFLLFEPPWSGEPIGRHVPVLAAAGLALIFMVLYRALALQRATRRVQRAWKRNASPLGLSARGCSVLEVRENGALLGTIGVLRPHVYASREVVSCLTGDELSAALAHEAAHIDAADNLKRLLVQSCSPGCWLDRRAHLHAEWTLASEIAADEGAIEAGACALDLASALVKVGRMHSSPHALSGASHLLATPAESQLAVRLRHLGRMVETGAPPLRQGRHARHAALWLAAATLLLYGTFFPRLMYSAHELLERFVR